MKLCLKCLRLREKSCPFRPEERPEIIRCTAFKKREGLPESFFRGKGPNRKAAGNAAGIAEKTPKRKYRHMNEVVAEKQPPLMHKIVIPDEVLKKLRIKTEEAE